MGECGEIPQSVIYHKNAMCYNKRLQGMPENPLVRRVFYELTNWDDMGFKTWETSVREPVSRYNMSLDSELNVNVYKKNIRSLIVNNYPGLTSRN